MGIKSGASSINGIYIGTTPIKEVYRGTNLIFSSDRGKLSLWRYSNDVIPEKTLLYNYIGNETYKCYGYYNDHGLLMPVVVNAWIDTETPYIGQKISINSPTNVSTYEIVNVSDTGFSTNYIVYEIGVPHNAFFKRKNSLDTDVIIYPELLYVPKCKGKSIINDWVNSTSSGTKETDRNTPFYNNPSVLNVDLQGVPFRNNSTYAAFNNCRNLCTVNNLNLKGANDLSYTFSNCKNFNSNVQIPSGVYSLNHTFSYCYKFNQKIRIPESVYFFYETFSDCSNLRQNIDVPSSAVDMRYTFSGINMLVNTCVKIYSSNVGKVGESTYVNADGCFNVSISNNSLPLPTVWIPDRYLNNAKTITYNSFKNSGWTWNEGNLAGTNDNKIRTWSFVGSNYSSWTGNNTHAILLKWSGLSDSYYAGYTVTKVVVPEVIRSYEPFPTALDMYCFRDNKILEDIDFGSDIPWTSNRLGYAKNTKAAYGAFEGCSNVKSIRGVINSSVNNLTDAFSDASSLEYADVIAPEGVVGGRGVFYNTLKLQCPFPLPSTVTTVYDLYGLPSKMIGNLKSIPAIPASAVNLSLLFSNRQENVGNIYILSPNVTDISNIWRNYPTSFKKSIYIYYQYSNGTNTITYNKFKGWAGYYNTSGNATDPMYSLATNFYVYNLSNVYNNMWNYALSGAPATKRIYLRKYIGIDEHATIMANYPDWTVSSIEPDCFSNCRNLKTIAMQNVLFNTTRTGNGNCQDLFRNCYNLRLVQGMCFTPVLYEGSGSSSSNGTGSRNIDISRAFENCYNLRVASIPDEVNIRNMSYTFANCFNLNFNVRIPNNILNLSGTFYNCVNLDRAIKVPNSVLDMSNMFRFCSNYNKTTLIPNSVTNMAYAFYGCTKLSANINIYSEEVENAVDCFNVTSAPKEVYIYYKYDNGEYTKTFNSFKSAGYIYKNEVSTGRNGTTFYDLSY